LGVCAGQVVVGGDLSHRVEVEVVIYSGARCAGGQGEGVVEHGP
jgi:hypothetical protein